MTFRIIMSLHRRQLGTVVYSAVAVVVEQEVEPLFVGAHEAVGVVDAALGAVAAFLVEHALARPVFRPSKLIHRASGLRCLEFGLCSIATESPPSGYSVALLSLGHGDLVS